MRIRTLLIGSLVLNAVLAGLWLTSREDPAPEPAPDPDTLQAGTDGSQQTNVVVRRQFFSWEELESGDYPTYIDNLRSVNCPEQTIRDIIIADVDHLFARRRASEALPLSRQWWQLEPDPDLVAVVERKLEALQAERDNLLTQLLGPDWNQPIQPIPTVAIKVPLEGSVLSSLSPETRDAVQAISGRTQQRYERALMAGGGDEPDPAALAGLEEQLRQDLAPLLTRGQLEEFLFRYSPSAQRLRAEMASIPYLDATDLELRTMFRNLEDIDLQLMRLEGRGSEAAAQRDALLRSREIAFRNALGPDRFRDFERLQDPAYQRAISLARAAGIESATELFYVIDRVGQLEREAILARTDLNPAQQELALMQMELEQVQNAAAALGEVEAPEPPPPPPVPPRTYTFQRGDTIADLSRQTGVPVTLILRANPGLPAEGIPPGTPIIIPDESSGPLPLPQPPMIR